MQEILSKICKKIEETEPNAYCTIEEYQPQIIVKFKNRKDVEIALLHPMAQMQVRKRYLDTDIAFDLITSVKRIANYNGVM